MCGPHEDNYEHLSRRFSLTTNGHHRFKILICLVLLLLLLIIGLIIGFNAAGPASTSLVITSDAVAQIGESVMLRCTFPPDGGQSSNILWEKVGDPGVVYRYENGKVYQNPQLKNRTSLFLDGLSVGNASLTIRNVEMKDAGVYKCTVSNSMRTAEGNLSLTVLVFSDLVISKISQTTLRCSASWYPRPSVTWRNATSGAELTRFSNTSYVPGLSGIITVISDYTKAEVDEHYICVIKNNLVRAVGNAVITASGLETSVYLDVMMASAAEILSPSLLLSCLLLLLCHLGSVIW